MKLLIELENRLHARKSAVDGIFIAARERDLEPDYVVADKMHEEIMDLRIAIAALAIHYTRQ